jgi:hypothetical protein
MGTIGLMVPPSGFRTTLSNPIRIRLVLLGLVVMPVAVLVLPFNVDGHFSDPHASQPRSGQELKDLSPKTP